MADNTLRLGKVHVVEWLRPDDMKTGRSLVDELAPMGIMSKPPVDVQFYSVPDRHAFVGVLRGLQDDYHRTKRSPILHIETHGDKSGLGPSQDDSIQWPELMEELIPLNRLTCMDLVVILAACEGFYGVQIQQPDRRAAACRALVGPNRPVTAGEMMDGCLAFYRTIFSARDGDAAFQEMNRAANPSQDTFWHIAAEETFRLVNQSHFREHCNPQALARRRDRLMSRLAYRFRGEHGCDPSQEVAGMWRTRISAHLLDQRSLFERLRRQYFFLDACRENDRRFDVTFEDCWPQDMELRIDEADPQPPKHC